MSAGMPAELHLQLFGQVVEAAFGEMPYHVGSSVLGKVWRDVDVRLILDDDAFDAMFPDKVTTALNSSAKWSAMCMAFSALGERMTGLPIDFQIQRRTDANEKYPHTRNPLGLGGPLHKLTRRDEP